MSTLVGKKVFLLGSILLLVLLGYGFLDEYLFYHEYYYQMLGASANRIIILSGVICGLLPVGYTFFAKKPTFRGVVGYFLGGLYLFSLISVAVKGNVFGFAAFLKLLINILFVYGLIIFLLVALTGFGGRIKESLLGLKTDSAYGVIFNMGIGLGGFLLILYLLLLVGLFYAGVSRALLLAAGRLLYERRDRMRAYGNILRETIASYISVPYTHGRLLLFVLPLLGCCFLAVSSVFGGASVPGYVYLFSFLGIALAMYYVYVSSARSDRGLAFLTTRKGVFSLFVFLLLLLSIRYLYNGFVLAFLPYPTAWDANHAYMFYPKMRALNNGYYRDVETMLTAPRIRLAFITYRFSLFVHFGGFLGVSTDTIAIELNGVSGIFVLIFGIALTGSFFQYLAKGKENSTESETVITSSDFLLLLGWFFLLQWLLSGMGMFLVFIDNKTDLGVLALIILALYSGITFLNKIQTGDQTSRRQIKTYICLSGFFYAIAVLAKPTAMFDVLNFFLLLRGLWVGTLGTLGVVLLVMGVLLLVNFRGIKDYIPSAIGSWLVGIGALGNLSDIVLRKMNQIKKIAVYLFLRIGTFAVVLLVLRLPSATARMYIQKGTVEIDQLLKNIYLSHDTTPQYQFVGHDRPLLAQSTLGYPSREQCSLASQGLTEQTLFNGLQQAPGSAYSEDVGRYIGFGWKGNPSDQQRGVTPFINPWRASFLSPGCYAFNPFGIGGKDAKLLCEQRDNWRNLDTATFSSLSSSLNPNSRAYEIVASVENKLKAGVSGSQIQETYRSELRELDAIMQSNSMLIVETEERREVYLPYRFLTFFNITFNWSLQNLSSYYTDIGIVRLILIIFTGVGFIYGLIARKRLLTILSLVTLFGWCLWMLIGGGILRYAIGIIVRTILSFLCFLHTLHEDILQEKTGTSLHMYRVTIFVLVVGIGLVQMTFNMARIASQGGQGAFMRYKTNVGIKEHLDETLARQAAPESGFGMQDVFNLQFPHYRKIIERANNREQGEGLFIAGTYLRYFIKDQHNVIYDQFLKRLREKGSDGDICNMYLRLKSLNIDYLVIDPNIGTVVQGEGNKSLFDRFFAEIGTDNNSIVSDGAITMLVKLFQGGYLQLVSTNNLGAKYAFILPDSAFQGVTGDELVLLRAKMAVARFFSNGSSIIQTIKSVADQRIADGTFVTDIADAYGLIIRENVLVNLARKEDLTAEDMVELTQDERKALSQFLGVKMMQGPQRDEVVTNMIVQTIGAGNQMIVLEVLD